METYRGIPGGDADELDPELDAQLYRSYSAALGVRRGVSIAATVRLSSNSYSPVVGKFSRNFYRGKTQPSYLLEMLPREQVRFQYLPFRESVARPCTTPYVRLNAKVENFLAVTRDASTGLIRIWVNGVMATMCYGVPGRLNSDAHALVVGSSSRGLGTGNAVMQIGQLNIYRRALTPQEIRVTERRRGID